MPFGRYRLLAQLGAGGMAVVYKAVVDGPHGFRREVVIKRMLSEYAEDPHFVAMMASEARLCALLRHPGIVQVSEFGQVDGEYYIAMELVDGSDLNTLMKRCRQLELVPPIEAICYVIHELAQALAYAHALADERGRPLRIVHRDVSPANVMVTPTGVVKLLDFGIAKAAGEIRDDRTRTGTIKGKFSYMSPEQTRGDDLDHRSDQFALGTVFHEFLTVRRLFKGESESDTLRRVCELDVPPPSAIRPAIPPELDAIVTKMLARDPADRYDSLADVATALEAVMERMGADRGALVRFLAQVGPLGPRGGRTAVEMVAEPGGPTPSQQNTIIATPPPSRRKLGAAVVGLAAGAATLVVALALVGMHGPAKVVPLAAQNVAPPPVAAPAPAAPVAAPPATPAPAAPAANVTLRVLGTSGAEVRVDDRLRGHTPLVLSLPRSSDAHVVTVRRAGYAPQTQRVAGDADSVVHAQLAPRKKSTATAARAFNPDVISDPFAR